MVRMYFCFGPYYGNVSQAQKNKSKTIHDAAWKDDDAFFFQISNRSRIAFSVSFWSFTDRNASEAMPWTDIKWQTGLRFRLPMVNLVELRQTISFYMLQVENWFSDEDSIYSTKDLASIWGQGLRPENKVRPPSNLTAPHSTRRKILSSAERVCSLQHVIVSQWISR